MSIYLLPEGDKLTDPDCFTPGIREYLAAEEALLTRLCRRYDSVIEACCTKGRYAPMAARAGKRYVGIDIAEHHIKDAERLYPDADFYCADIARLKEIMAATGLRGSCILVFPFNAFGNLGNAAALLEIIAGLQLPCIIMTYNTSSDAAAIRREYYAAAGFHDIILTEEPDGTRFRCGSGLDSIAYSAAWFMEMFARYHMQYRALPFGQIGMAYLNF